MATPTSAGASPAAHSPPEEDVEEVDELTALPDEEPLTAAEEKSAHVGLLRVSRCLTGTCYQGTIRLLYNKLLS